MKKIIYFSLVMLAVLIIFFTGEDEMMHGPGITAPDEPVQQNFSRINTFSLKGYILLEKAEFSLKARVLGKERYHTEENAGLVPYDLVFGWGPMSDERNLANIEISQHSRFYHWYTEKFPIPRREIEKNSANMHLIPASWDVMDIIGEIRVGNIVRLKGKLVDFINKKGKIWRTSLSRKDTGSGACEIIYTEELEILK
jgi:hypothetical protein